MSNDLRHALSHHDTTTPLTWVEMLNLAREIEESLVNSESNFSDPGWRQVDGLRALVRWLDAGPKV